MHAEPVEIYCGLHRITRVLCGRGQQSPRASSASYQRLGATLLFSCSPVENRLVWMRPCQAAGLGHRSRGTDHAWCAQFSATRPDNATVDDLWPGPARRRRPRAANPFVGAMSMGNTVTATTPPSAPTVSMSSPPSKPVTEAVPSQKQRTIKSPTRRRRCACSRGGGHRRAGIADVKSSPAVVGQSPVPPAPLERPGYTPVVSTNRR